MNGYDLDEVMTVPEVASYLKLAKSTIYRLVQSGDIPGRKVGGAWRFSRKVIDKWMEQLPSVSEAPLADN